jgi:hypothetical protein
MAAAHWGRAYSWTAPAVLAALYFATAAAMTPNNADFLVIVPWLFVDSVATLCGALLYMRRFERREA